MPEELGKIEKPAVDEFKGGRKLFFVPLVSSGKDLPLEFIVKVDHYWDEVDAQISNLESKLGQANRIYQELVPQDGEEGFKLIKEMSIGSQNLIRNRMDLGAVLTALEDTNILAELMDWSRCLSLGLQSPKVFSKVYEFYNATSKARDESIAKKLSESLKENENAIFIMSEGHHVQFPADIKVFYVSPPSLDSVKRWVRDYEAKMKEKEGPEADIAPKPDQQSV